MTTVPIQPKSGPNANKKNSMTLVLVAFAIGVVAVIVNVVAFAQAKESARTAIITVYRLNRDVEPGTKFDFGKHVEELKIPQEFRDLDIFRGATDETTVRNRDGQLFRRSANRGSPIIPLLFQATEMERDLDIPKGQKAATLPVNSRNAPGFLREGMFIDVLATVQPEGEQAEIYLVMEHVQVAKVGNQSAGRRVTSYSSITILVSHDDYKKLLYISNFVGGAKGFDIAIRNPTDRPELIGVNPSLLKKLNYRETGI